MGRAHEVRAASMAKTAAVKSKLYSIYAKEIIKTAKGNPDPNTNVALKRVIERAKKEQVPTDVINRNIERAKGGNAENYDICEYEAFGTGASTLIVKCLTDNVNRTLAEVKTVFNKCGAKLAGMNAVSYNYDHLCVIGFKGLNEEETMDLLFSNDIEVDDIEVEDDITVVYSNPENSNKIKTVIESALPNVEYETDEIGYYSKEKIKLEGEQKEKFIRLIDMLNELDDVSNVYHNVEL